MADRTPEIREREVDQGMLARCLDAGMDPVAARVVASRLGGRVPEISRVVDPRVSDLDAPFDLPDIDRASARIARAVAEGELIAVETDHDVDGVTSHAVIHQALTKWFRHPPDRIASFIGHRLKEGYGLSRPVAERIAQAAPSIVITADNGSSDEERIAWLAERGIHTIVTDHHAFPVEGPPASAFAVVSPARGDSAYPDRTVAGCMVSWLLMCAVRRRLIGDGRIPGDTPNLGALLDFVSLGTVADCVDLGGSLNNRAVVRYGMYLIENQVRPCWRAVYRRLGEGPLNARDLAFTIAPRINARGRLDEAMAGVKFLIAETDDVAEQWEELLHETNQERKRIERSLLDQAETVAGEQVDAGRHALVVYLPDGHAGVHGIVASRLVEAFGRPALCLSPKLGEPGVLAGSARTALGLHVRNAMQAVEDAHPGMFLKFGGHAGAGGCTIRLDDLDSFIDAYDKAVAEQTGAPGSPVVLTDGDLPPERITLDTVVALEALDPYGEGFPQPVFTGSFRVTAVRPVGDGSHLKLRLAADGTPYDGIWFNACPPAVDGEPDGPLPVAEGDEVRVAFALEANRWRGEDRLQLRVAHLERRAGVMRRVASW